MLAITVFFVLATGWSRANPEGERVMQGQMSFNRLGNSLIITQGNDRAVVNWQTFSIGKGELTRFIQPGKNSSALNRVLGGTRSLIDGRLEANGQVILVNPAGITVGKGGVINVNSFIGSTQDITDENFIAGGKLRFSGGSDADITNLGTIKAETGDVILVAKKIVNEGTIEAPEGTVGLAAASDVLVQPDAEEKLYIQAGSSSGGAISNEGTIKAVTAEIKAAGNPYALAINLNGVVEAKGKTGKTKGVIRVDAGEGNVKIAQGARLKARNADGSGGTVEIQKGAPGQNKGDVEIAGEIDANGEAGKGGRVEIYGRRVTLADTAQVGASGADGGGVVRVGGGREGKDTTVRNSEGVYIADGAQVRADATLAGEGGEVIVYARDVTFLYGELSARGADGGKGGFIETSGGSITFGNHVPEAGKGGEWLIDPYSITIQATGPDSGISGGPAWATGSNASSILTTGSILAALNAGTSVTVTTSNNILGGDIAILSPIAKTAGGDATLTLNAIRDINIYDSITSSSGALSLVFNADTNADGQGAIILQDKRASGNAAAMIDTNGGSIDFNGNMAAIGKLSGGSSTAQLLIDAARADLTGGSIRFGGEFFIANPNANSALDGIRIQAGSDADVTFTSLVDSGNYYELVSGSYEFGEALVDAKSGVGNLVGDTYLATVTSSLEASIAGAASGYAGAWIGGSDETTEGVWRWITGPEGLEDGGLGRIFYVGNRSGTATPLTGYAGYDGAYVNWNAGEPNNAGGSGEHALMLGWGGQGLWNDYPLTGGFVNPYVKETNLAASGLIVSGRNVFFQGNLGSNVKLGNLTLDNTGNVVFGSGVSSANLEGSLVVHAGATAADRVIIESTALAIKAGGSVNILRETGDGTVDGSLGGLTIEAGGVNIGADGDDASIKLKNLQIKTSTLTVRDSTLNASGNLVLLVDAQPDFDAESSLSGLSGTSVTGVLQIRPRDGTKSLGIGDEAEAAPGVLHLTTGFLNAVVTGDFSRVIFGGTGMTGDINLASASPVDISANTTIQTAGDVRFGRIGMAGASMLIASGVELVASAGGDIILDGALIVEPGASGYDVILEAGNAFLNNVGSGALVTAGGRWLIYSPDPGANVFNHLQSGGLPVWGQTPDTLAPSAVAAGNHYIFAFLPSALTVTSLDQMKTEGVEMDFSTPVEGVDYEVTGFVDASLYGGVWVQETAANSISGAPLLVSTGGPAAAALGDYPIVITAGTLVSLTGYTMTMQSTGELSVVPVPPTPETPVIVEPNSPSVVNIDPVDTQMRMEAEQLAQPPQSDTGTSSSEQNTTESTVTLPQDFASALGVEMEGSTASTTETAATSSAAESAAADGANNASSGNSAASSSSAAQAGSSSTAAASTGGAAPGAQAPGPGTRQSYGSYGDAMGAMSSPPAKRSQSRSTNPESAPSIAALTPLKEFTAVFLFIVVASMAPVSVAGIRPK